MTVKDIIRAHQACFIENCCTNCPLITPRQGNCQITLARETIDKLNNLTELLDDKVNHHYYDTLEFYQEENTKLINRLNKIHSALSE